MRFMYKIYSLFFLFFLLVARPISSENLADVYELALKNDPLLRAAEATFRAGKENKAQGIAGLLPCLLYTSPSPRD